MGLRATGLCWAGPGWPTLPSLGGLGWVSTVHTPQLRCLGDDRPVGHDRVVDVRERQELYSPSSCALSGGFPTGQTTAPQVTYRPLCSVPIPPCPCLARSSTCLSPTSATLLGPVLLQFFHQRCILTFLKSPRLCGLYYYFVDDRYSLLFYS